METGNPGGIRTYHARRGRLSPSLARVLVELTPRLGVPDEPPLLDLPMLFEGRPVVLEIGSGMGHSTVTMARANPDTGILAVEVHTPGVAALMRDCAAHDLTNVRVAHTDGVALLADRIAPGTLAGFRAYFPDPWPKARHHKRRLIRPDLVDLIASRLQPGAELELATDWPDYAYQMLAVLGDHAAFDNPHGGFAPRPAHRPSTKFERKGLRQGRHVFDLVLTRR